jgi:hypothetical protein
VGEFQSGEFEEDPEVHGALEDAGGHAEHPETFVWMVRLAFLALRREGGEGGLPARTRRNADFDCFSGSEGSRVSMLALSP